MDGLPELIHFSGKVQMMRYYTTLFVLFMFPLALLATTVRSGERIQIDQPIQDNAYLAGGTIEINAPVAGDLSLAGGEIYIREKLLQDGLILGGEISIEALSQDDLRMIGGDIAVRESVAGDLVVLGGEVLIDKQVTVGGDLLVLGGEITVKGTITGNVHLIGGEIHWAGTAMGSFEASGGRLWVRGTVGGPATLRMQEVELYDHAQFMQTVRYWQPSGSIDFSGHLAEGATARYDDDLAVHFPEFNWQTVKEEGLMWLRLFQALSGLLLTVLISLLLGRFFRERAGQRPRKVNAAMGYGALSLIGLPIVGVIAMATVIAMPIGVIAFSLWLILALIAQALAAVLLTYEWKSEKGYTWNPAATVGVAACLFLAMRLIALIPFAGALFNAALSLWAVGYFLILLARKKPVSSTMDTGDDEMV